MQFSKRLKMGFFKFIFPFSRNKNKEKRIEMHSRIQFSLICDLGMKIRRPRDACIEVKEIAENDRITIFLYKRGIPEV